LTLSFITMAKSLGTLYVDVVGRLEGLEKDMARAKKIIGETDDAVKKSGGSAKAAFESFSLFNSFKGRGLLGIVSDVTAVSMAFRAIANEVKYVYDNIDKIPGISPQARVSVNEFKQNLFAAKNALHQLLAIGMDATLTFGTALGVHAAALMPGAGGIDAVELKAQLDAMDKIAEANDPGYWDKVRGAQVLLSEARKRDAVAALDNAGRIKELRAQAEAYEKFAASASITTLQRVEAEAKAHDRSRDAGNLEKEQRTKFNTLMDKVRTESIRDGMLEMSQMERIVSLQKQIENSKALTTISRKPGESLALTTEEIERVLKHMPLQLEMMKSLREELSRIKSPAMEFKDTFVAAMQGADEQLTSFVTGGSLKLSDFLKNMSDSIIDFAMRMAIINPILNGVFGGVTGMSVLPSIFNAGKRASGGPASGLTWVGEQGPELLNLPSGSNVIPAESARRAGAGGGGNNYQIDARGADAGMLARLEQLLFQMAGPGVVEQRALSAQQNSRWRNTGIG